MSFSRQQDSNQGPGAQALGRAVRGGAAALCVAALALTGCARGSNNTNNESQSESGMSFSPDTQLQGKLEIMGFNRKADEVASTRTDLAEKAIAPATLDAPAGELDIQQLLSAIAAGKAPDLIYANRDQLGSLAARKAIMPLDSCIDGEGIPSGDFRESAIAQATFDGRIYGVPEFNQVQIIMANGQLLNDAGVALEDLSGQDPARITDATGKLMQHQKGKLSTIGFDPKLPEFLPLWAMGQGAKLVSDDGRTAQLNDPHVVSALEFGTALYDQQDGFGTVKSLRDSADFFGKDNQFAKEQLGAMPMEQWYVNILNDVSPKVPMAFTTMKTTSGDPMSFATGSAWAIPAGGDNPQAACRFIRNMTATDTWLAAAEARSEARLKDKKPFTGLFTANKAADEQIKARYVDTNEYLTSPWSDAVEASYTANDHSFAMPALPADAEFKQVWLDAVNSVLSGNASVQEALDSAQSEAQGVLDKAWSDWEANSSPASQQ